MEAILQHLSSLQPQSWLLFIYLMLLMSGAGLPMPEEIPLLMLSYLYFNQYIEHWGWIPLAICAVSLADFSLYNIGKFFGYKVIQWPIIKKRLTEKKQRKFKVYIRKYGNKIIFMGRFLFGLRSAIFLSAGIFKVPWKTFLALDFLASTLSTGLVLTISYFLLKKFNGQLQQVQDILVHYQSQIGRGILIVAACVALSLLLRQNRALKHQ